MISKPFSLPSATPEVLSGEVQERDEHGVWRTVWLPNFKVTDNRKRTPPTFPRMQKIAEEQLYTLFDPGYPDMPVYTVTRDFDGRIHWHH